MVHNFLIFLYSEFTGIISWFCYFFVFWIALRKRPDDEKHLYNASKSASEINASVTNIPTTPNMVPPPVMPPTSVGIPMVLPHLMQPQFGLPLPGMLYDSFSSKYPIILKINPHLFVRPHPHPTPFCQKSDWNVFPSTFWWGLGECVKIRFFIYLLCCVLIWHFLRLRALFLKNSFFLFLRQY